jgi:hypothetical protein
MIRDPSDGSVREKHVDAKAASMSTRAELPSGDKPLMSSTTSGLQTGNGKPENLARLEKSRQWLKDYHAGNITPETAIADDTA